MVGDLFFFTGPVSSYKGPFEPGEIVLARSVLMELEASPYHCDWVKVLSSQGVIEVYIGVDDAVDAKLVKLWGNEGEVI